MKNKDATDDYIIKTRVLSWFSVHYLRRMYCVVDNRTEVRRIQFEIFSLFHYNNDRGA
jgi:hypothetical protein